ncbi:hypothetical protein [Lentibacillus salicampi]|uniref:Uncharacterized protein n=1 Tax=Lentibacillus salicampi TaxID=175306 RepID=A0A4Y9AFP1_9BACI|nr:hypothetical protein [Lentibacillus salicampi]TFJ94245.1 hypothetical protein E4U82_03025 [Lentibacillus salicampi]
MEQISARLQGADIFLIFEQKRAGIGRRTGESAEEGKNQQKNGKIGRRTKESAEERKNQQKNERIGRRTGESGCSHLHSDVLFPYVLEKGYST